jgi:hypothetical protein
MLPPVSTAGGERSGGSAGDLVQRDVAAGLAATIVEPASVVLALAVADGYDLVHEQLVVELDGQPVPVRELTAGHRSRLHVTGVLQPGQLRVAYEASVGAWRPAAVSGDELDRIAFLRPSRYCESDRFAPMARSDFGGLTGHALVDAVAAWVHEHLAYVGGSSRPTDGAVATFLAREGVCRDFAHLVVALLRAADVPARLVSVYAPGLDPMDFHAVAEAWVGGEWFVVDATGLGPRTAMVRVCTGRDAADTAFMTSHGGAVLLDSIEVVAVAQPMLPDDPGLPVRLR